MKQFVVPLAGLVLAAGVGAATAASPAYCALYAREYANQFTEAAGQSSGAERRIQDEAYYRCLNLDQEPALPTTSAYFGTDVTNDGGTDAPPDAAEAGPDAGDPAEAAPGKPVRKAEAAPKRRYYGSGLTAWSPEWKAWCKAHFPNSFDEETGMILPLNGKRMFCR